MIVAEILSAGQSSSSDIPAYGLHTAVLSGDECLPDRRRCPPVRAVDRRNLLRVQLLGDLVQRHPSGEHCVDPLPPLEVPPVADPMREPHVVRSEMASVHPEPRIVVGRRRPVGARRDRLEVPSTPEAVALGHLAAHVDQLAVSGKLPEDSAHSQRLELLDRRCLGGCRCHRESSWTIVRARARVVGTTLPDPRVVIQVEHERSDPSRSSRPILSGGSRLARRARAHRSTRRGTGWPTQCGSNATASTRCSATSSSSAIRRTDRRPEPSGRGG